MNKRIGQKVRESLERIDSGLSTSEDAKLLRELITSTYRICSEQNPDNPDMRDFLADLEATPEQIAGNNVINFPIRGIRHA